MEDEEGIPAEPVHRVGFLAGAIEVPEDFDRMGEAEIEALFEGDCDGTVDC